MVGKQKKHKLGMTPRESSSSYKTKDITVITRKLTLANQKAQEGKKALKTSPKEASIHKEMERQRSSKTRNRYAKTTSYRLLLDH